MKDTKICVVCEKEKDLNAFERHMSKGRLFGWRKDCRECRYKIAWERRQTPEWRKHHRAYRRKQYRNQTPDQKLQQQIWQSGYALTVPEYKKLLEDQKHVCAICGRKNPDGRRLFIDHDHETGKIRGLLCRDCNWALGIFGNDPDWCRRAMEYLRK